MPPKRNRGGRPRGRGRGRGSGPVMPVSAPVVQGSALLMAEDPCANTNTNTMGSFLLLQPTNPAPTNADATVNAPVDPSTPISFSRQRSGSGSPTPTSRTKKSGGVRIVEKEGRQAERFSPRVADKKRKGEYTSPAAVVVEREPLTPRSPCEGKSHSFSGLKGSPSPPKRKRGRPRKAQAVNYEEVGGLIVRLKLPERFRGLQLKRNDLVDNLADAAVRRVLLETKKRSTTTLDIFGGTTMAPVGDRRGDDGKDNEVDVALKEVVQHLFEIQSDTAGYLPETQEALVSKIENLTSSLTNLKSLTEPPSSNDPRLNPDITREIIDYVDKGRNPDVYSRELVEATVRMNQSLNGKMKAFGDFSEVFAQEIKAAGGLGMQGQVDRVMRAGEGVGEGKMEEDEK